jgi:hypothetical protein
LPARRVHRSRGRCCRGRSGPTSSRRDKLAETFGVATDYLLVDGAARRPFRAPDDALGQRLTALAQLSPDDRNALIRIIDHMIANTQARAALTHAS